MIRQGYFFLILLLLILGACTSKLSINKTLESSESTESSQATPGPSPQPSPAPSPAPAPAPTPNPSPGASCNFSGIVMNSGTTKTVYSAAVVGCSVGCSAGQVSCNNGVLSGNTGYTALSCSQMCNCTTPWGQNVAQGDSTTGYKIDTYACSSTTNACADPTNKIVVRCDDALTAKLTIVSGAGPINQYTSPTCTPPTCGCVYQGQLIPGGSTIPVYKSSTAVAPAHCTDAANAGRVTCTLTGGNFVLSGDNNQSTYPYTSCQDSAAGSGGTGWGTGGGSGGGTGNSSGPGDGFQRSGISGGAGCDATAPPYYCVGFDLSFSPVSSMCYLPTEAGYGTPPTGAAQRVTPGSYIPAFSVKTVHCPDRCSKHMALVHCDSGVMSEKANYPYLDCVEICP